MLKCYYNKEHKEYIRNFKMQIVSFNANKKICLQFLINFGIKPKIETRHWLDSLA